MQCDWRKPLAAAVLLVTVFGRADCGAAQSADPVAKVLADLDAWLATSSQGPGWRRYLHLEPLQRDFADDGVADLALVGRALRAFSSDVPGLDQTRFAEARRALERWFQTQTNWPLEELPQAIEQAKDDFVPLAAPEVERRRRRLEAAMRALERFLAQANRARQSAWKRYLQWDDLRREIARPGDPNLEVLRTASERLNRPEVGLELEPFVAVRKALRDYYNGVLVLRNANLEQEYRAALDILKNRVESYLAEPTTDTASQIAEALGYLQDIGQAPQIVGAIRQHFDRPNLRVTMSRDLLAAGVERAVDEPTYVREVILGTSVRGYGRTRGRIRLSLAPSKEHATLILHLDAEAHTRNVGVNGPATIYSTGATDIQASHTVHLSEAGIAAGNVFARACVDTYIYAIGARLRLVERIAWRRARQTLPQAEAIASGRATARARSQFAQQVRQQLAEPNENLEDRILAPLRRWQVLPDWIRFSTTSNQMAVTLRHATERQLAARSPLPAEVGGDLSIRIHESAVGNFSESAVAGRTYGPEDFIRLAKQFPLQGRQGELQLEDDRDWSIIFRDRHPLAAEFRDGQVIFRIGLSGFTTEGRAYNYAMIATVPYQIASSPDGPKLARPEGTDPIDITWPGRRVTLQLRVFQEKFRHRFAALFPTELFVQDLTPENAPPGFGALRDFLLRSEDGWFTAGFRRLRL